MFEAKFLLFVRRCCPKKQGNGGGPCGFGTRASRQNKRWQVVEGKVETVCVCSAEGSALGVGRCGAPSVLLKGNRRALQSPERSVFAPEASDAPNGVSSQLVFDRDEGKNRLTSTWNHHGGTDSWRQTLNVN